MTIGYSYDGISQRCHLVEVCGKQTEALHLRSNVAASEVARKEHTVLTGLS